MNFALVFVGRLQDANTSAVHRISQFGSPGVDSCWRMWRDEIKHAVTSTPAIIAEHTKQPSTFLQADNGLADILRSCGLRCDNQHSKSLCTESGSMDASGIRSFIRLQLSQHTALPKIMSLDRHGSTVCFEKVVGAFDATIRMRHLKREDLVRHHADTTLAGEINRPAKGFTVILSAFGLRQFVSEKQTNIRTLAAVEFERGHEVTDHEGVLQEETANAFVSSRPIHALEGHVEVAAKSACAA